MRKYSLYCKNWKRCEHIIMLIYDAMVEKREYENFSKRKWQKKRYSKKKRWGLTNFCE